MTWIITDNGDGTVTAEWRDYEATADGNLSSLKDGYPADAQDAVNELLKTINSTDEQLEALAEYNPAHIVLESDA